MKEWVQLMNGGGRGDRGHLGLFMQTMQVQKREEGVYLKSSIIVSSYMSTQSSDKGAILSPTLQGKGDKFYIGV